MKTIKIKGILLPIAIIVALIIFGYYLSVKIKTDEHLKLRVSTTTQTSLDLNNSNDEKDRPSNQNNSSSSDPSRIEYHFEGIIKSIEENNGEKLVQVTQHGTPSAPIPLYEGYTGDITMEAASCDVVRSNVYSLVVSYYVGTRTYACESARIGFIDW